MNEKRTTIMSKKFIKVKRVEVPMISLVILSSLLMGCSTASEERVSDTSTSSFVQIEVKDISSSTSGSAGQSQVDIVEKVEPLKWTPLYTIMSYSNIRNTAKEALGIKAFEGSVFIDTEGHQEMNNTLYNALRNEVFAKEQLENKDTVAKLTGAVEKTFADIGDSENEKMAAFFNSFWELMPEENGEEAKEFNGSETLSRAQAMTLVMRAMTPVEKNNKPNENKLFTEAVGDSVYTDFAQYVDNEAYLNTKNGLTKSTFNGKMTRAEYLWLCMHSVFSEAELAEIETAGIELIGVKEGENETIDDAMVKPSKGLPANVVEMLKKARALGLVEEQPAWDLSITKADAVQIFVNTVKVYGEKNGYAVKSDKAREDELLTAKAKASYERLKDKVILDEAGYIKEYTRLANQGFEEEEIEQNILAEYGKREEPKPTESKPTETTKPTESKPTESKPTQSSTSTRPPEKFTGTLKKPIEQYPGEVKVIGERETGVSIINREVSGYMVETPGGKFWFCETDGGYYRSMSDKLTRKSAAKTTEIFPNRDYSKWKDIRLS